MKVLCAIQSLDDRAIQLVDYSALLSIDSVADMTLVGSHNILSNAHRPVSITGEGIPSLALGAMEETIRISKDHIHELKDRALRRGVENVEVDFRIGPLSRQIIDVDEEIDNLLWTVLRRSNSSWMNDVLGTMETDLSKRLSSPTLVVPFTSKYRKPKKLLVLVGQGEERIGHRTFVELKSRLAFDCHYLIEVAREKKIEETPMSRFKNRLDVPFNQIRGQLRFVNENDMADTLTDSLEDLDPDWLVLLRTDQGLFKRVFNSFGTNHLVLASDRPVLVC